MAPKIIKIATIGALALLPTLSYAQNSEGALAANDQGAAARDRAMSKGKSHIQKQTKPKKNGTTRAKARAARTRMASRNKTADRSVRSSGATGAA
jgi:hypothetical protein